MAFSAQLSIVGRLGTMMQDDQRLSPAGHWTSKQGVIETPETTARTEFLRKFIKTNKNVPKRQWQQRLYRRSD